MEFSVLRLRCNGRPLPRRDWMNQTPVAGDLRVDQLYVKDLRRSVRIARVLDPQRPMKPDELPMLFDPVLLAMSPQAFTLIGFERIEGVDYARSWLCMEVQQRGLASDGTGTL